MISNNNQLKQIEFYKNRIIAQIDNIKDYISDVKYRLYISMVNECNDYDDIRQLSELDLQIDMFKYIKDIKEKLEYYDTDLNELSAVCDKSQRTSQMIIISHSKKKKTTDNGLNLSREDIVELMEDNEATTAMAMMIAMQLQNQPINETYRDQLLNTDEEENTDAVSIYDVDNLNIDSLLNDDSDEEDNSEDEIEIEGFDDIDIEDEELDDEDKELDDEDEELDSELLSEIFASEEPKEKISLKNMVPNFSDDDEDDDIIDLDNNKNDSVFADEEESEDELDFDIIDDNDIFAEDFDEDDEEEDDIDIDSLLDDTDDSDEDEEDTDANSDNIDIDSLLDDEAFGDEDDLYGDISDSEESDDIDIDSLIDDEDDEDEEVDEEESDDIDIDSLIGDDEDIEEDSGDEEESEEGFSIDIDALVEDDEDDEEDIEDNSPNIDIDIDEELDNMFDIDESEFLGGEKEVDVNDLDDDISKLFGHDNNTGNNNDTEQKIIPVDKREIKVDKIFINGTDRGKKTQDMFSALDRLFSRTGRITNSAVKNVRKHVNNSDLYNIRKQGTRNV